MANYLPKFLKINYLNLTTVRKYLKILKQNYRFLLMSIDGGELFTHLCIKLSSKPFEDWDCDLPFTSFGKHSFRKFWCSTRVAFSQSTNTFSLIFCLSSSNDCSNNLSCLCACSSACLAADFVCSSFLQSSPKDKYHAFEDPVAE